MLSIPGLDFSCCLLLPSYSWVPELCLGKAAMRWSRSIPAWPCLLEATLLCLPNSLWSSGSHFPQFLLIQLEKLFSQVPQLSSYPLRNMSASYPPFYLCFDPTFIGFLLNLGLSTVILFTHTPHCLSQHLHLSFSPQDPFPLLMQHLIHLICLC